MLLTKNESLLAVVNTVASLTVASTPIGVGMLALIVIITRLYPFAHGTPPDVRITKTILKGTDGLSLIEGNH